MTPWSLPPPSSRIGDTVRPRCETLLPAIGAIGIERRAIGCPRSQALFEHVGNRRGALQHVAVRAPPVVIREAEHRLAGGVERADVSAPIDDEQA